MISLASLVPALLRGEASVPEEWSQGRTAYGGLLAAVGMEALKGLIPEGRRAKSFTVAFLGPIPPGQAFEVKTAILASGKSMTVGQVQIEVDGEVRFSKMVTYAADRSSAVAVAPASAPTWPAAEELPALPFIPKVTPNFTQALEYRWAEGPMPFSGAKEGFFGGYFRFRDEAGAPEVALAGMFDAWPPAVLPLMKGPAPASTVNWSVQIFDPPDVRKGDWWRYRAHTVAASAGTATTKSELFAPDGLLVACAEQLVAIYG